MATPSKTCIKCGAPIENTASTGRPRAYCTSACQRAAGHEVRRINSLLEKLELLASHARRGHGSSPANTLKRLTAEIELIETRLRDLLADPDESES